MKIFQLTKEERLSKKKLIQELFVKGSSFYLYPFKVIFLPSGAKTNQILITVPKSIFKRAVDRNKIKRRIREGYRLNKAVLTSDKNFLITYIYTAKEILDSAVIHQKITQSLTKITELK
ncbi:MAG: ribonuclease P protein component [Cyclobacteriaceae bacterium]